MLNNAPHDPSLPFLMALFQVFDLTVFNQGRIPEAVFAVLFYIQKSLHGCFHDVKSLHMGSLKVYT